MTESRTILVFEPSPERRERLAAALAPDFRVVLAANAYDALARADELPIELAVVGSGAREYARLLREHPIRTVVVDDDADVRAALG